MSRPQNPDNNGRDDDGKDARKGQPARGRATGKPSVPAPRSGTSLPPGRRCPIGRGARMVSYVGLAVLGVVIGLAGALIVDLWSGGGLVLGAAGVLALTYGGSVLTGTKTGAALPTLTWLVTLLLASLTTPVGSQLLDGSATGVALLFLGLLGSVLCIARPSLSPLTSLPPAGPRHDRSQ
ncbi:DUF6113 family protein [Streptacidiphilus sp. MAP5-3]|uniref:DUF6113 family protein n=1 Tax=unclassified Streptacidiphilus TaxID=2643834 RepID=UPI0035123F38